MKAIKILGVEGKKCNIIPTTFGKEDDLRITEIFNKKSEYLCNIYYDHRWKCYVLADLDSNFQMSKDCIDDAFKLTEEYWNKYMKK